MSGKASASCHRPVRRQARWQTLYVMTSEVPVPRVTVACLLGTNTRLLCFSTFSAVSLYAVLYGRASYLAFLAYVSLLLPHCSMITRVLGNCATDVRMVILAIVAFITTLLIVTFLSSVGIFGTYCMRASKLRCVVLAVFCTNGCNS